MILFYNNQTVSSISFIIFITCSLDILKCLYKYDYYFRVEFLKHIIFVRMVSNTNLRYWSLHKKPLKIYIVYQKTPTDQDIFPGY